jgi:hypothetical protein
MERLPKKNIPSNAEPLRSSKSVEPSGSAQQRLSPHGEVSPGLSHPISPVSPPPGAPGPEQRRPRLAPTPPIVVPPSPDPVAAPLLAQLRSPSMPRMVTNLVPLPSPMAVSTAKVSAPSGCLSGTNPPGSKGPARSRSRRRRLVSGEVGTVALASMLR